MFCMSEQLLYIINYFKKKWVNALNKRNFSKRGSIFGQNAKALGLFESYTSKSHGSILIGSGVIAINRLRLHKKSKIKAIPKSKMNRLK